MRALCLLLLLPCFAHGEIVTKDIVLFNGKDLTNFYTFLGAPMKGAKAYGKNNDPEKVFTVENGMIRVSGKVFGCFVTEKEYQNYRLITEFKWGEKTWAPREDKTRDSGILLHCVGEDGAAGGVWLESIEAQLIEGGSGDFILVKGKKTPSMTAPVEFRPTPSGQTDKKQPYYNPMGKPLEFVGGRINWYGRDPDWKDVKGFRGKQDVERPVGEWNTMECICDRDKITILLNGKIVNSGTNASHTHGRILFQSEGAEVFFRKIELKPLSK